MTLSDRLQTELIGPKPKSKCTGVDCPGCDYGRAETALKPKIEAAIANIEADLKGEFPQAKNPCHGKDFDPNHTCNMCQWWLGYEQAREEHIEAVEHYCRSNT